MRTASFAKRLEVAAATEAYVASLFTQAGFYVLCCPIFLGKKSKEADLELWAVRPDAGMTRMTELEVKGSSGKNFTSKDDYPYKSFAVCAEKAFIAGGSIRRDFAFVSADRACVLIYPKEAPVTIGKIRDTTRFHTYNCLMGDRDLLITVPEYVSKIRA